VGGGALHSGVVPVPVARVGIGIATLLVARAGGADTVRAPIFVSLGEDLPVASYEEMLGYLRYYAAPERIRALRDTAPELRAAAWAAFLKESDPILSTPQHESLREYFGRIRLANERFRDEGGPGWQSERGMALIVLGEPDQVFEQGTGDNLGQRGRTQVWEYRERRLAVYFVDASGFGRWRLTPQSLADVNAAMRQRMVK
jgi:GWxTD domain-containing protein